MNCTESMVGSPPSHILLPSLKQPSHIAWAMTMVFSGASLPCSQPLRTDTYGTFVHIDPSKIQFWSSAQIQWSCAKALAETRCLLRVPTTRSFRIQVSPVPGCLSSSCLPPLQVTSPSPPSQAWICLELSTLHAFSPRCSAQRHSGWNLLLLPALAC